MTNKPMFSGDRERDLEEAVEWMLKNKSEILRKAGIDTEKLRALLDKPVCGACGTAIRPDVMTGTACDCSNPAAQHQGERVTAKVRGYTPGMGLVELRVTGGIPSWLELGEVVTVVAGDFHTPRHQGEPVACMPVDRCYDVRAKMIIAFNEAKKAGGDLDDALDAAYKSALRYSPNPMTSEQPAPVAVIPDGYCIMPRRLTAENGAKALLIGEFTLEVTMDCPECSEMEEPSEGCGICDGEGEYGQKHTISWDKIKFIYSEAVKGLAK